MKLFDAIRATGWEPLLCAYPARRRDRLGKPGRHAEAAALCGGRIAVRGTAWRYAYAVSHEIAEAAHGFKHSETLFMSQANLLAFWHELRSGRRPKMLSAFAPSAPE